MTDIDLLYDALDWLVTADHDLRRATERLVAAGHDTAAVDAVQTFLVSAQHVLRFSIQQKEREEAAE